MAPGRQKRAKLACVGPEAYTTLMIHTQSPFRDDRPSDGLCIVHWSVRGRGHRMKFAFGAPLSYATAFSLYAVFVFGRICSIILRIAARFPGERCSIHASYRLAAFSKFAR